MTVQENQRFISFLKNQLPLRSRTKLKKFIENIFRKEKKKLQTTQLYFLYRRILLSNKQGYLNHDYYTDIITFELSTRGEPVEGEIYISVDRIIENALSFGESRMREIHRVIFHGALHLCGYKDNRKSGKKENERKGRLLSQMYL